MRIGSRERAWRCAQHCHPRSISSSSLRPSRLRLSVCLLGHFQFEHAVKKGGKKRKRKKRQRRSRHAAKAIGRWLTSGFCAFFSILLVRVVLHTVSYLATPHHCASDTRYRQTLCLALRKRARACLFRTSTPWKIKIIGYRRMALPVNTSFTAGPKGFHASSVPLS